MKQRDKSFSQSADGKHDYRAKRNRNGSQGVKRDIELDNALRIEHCLWDLSERCTNKSACASDCNLKAKFKARVTSPIEACLACLLPNSLLKIDIAGASALNTTEKLR